jgi:hypothetical protein
MGRSGRIVTVCRKGVDCDSSIQEHRLPAIFLAIVERESGVVA